MILNYCRVSLAYNFQTGENKIKLLMEYESATLIVSYGNAIIAALMSGRKYGVIPQNGDCSGVRLRFSKQVRYQNATSLRTYYGKESPSDNATRRLLK
jgi:hypothetical protein